MATEIIEIVAPPELIVIDGDEAVVIEIEVPAIEIIETAEQGPAGPSGTDAFDNDLALLYQIAKL